MATTNLPPEKPGSGQGSGFPEFGGEPEIEETLDKGTPAVSVAPGKTLVVVIGLLGVVAFILISLFMGDNKKPNNVVPDNKKGMQKPIAEEPAPLPPPTLPPAPTLPPTVVPPPPPPQVNDKPAKDVDFSNPNNNEMRARLQSESIIYNSRNGLFASKDDKSKDKKPQNINDPNSWFAQNAIRNSEAEKAESTTIGDLNHTIAQGKMIDVVLETAVNTDLPGTLRAIVSNDVYAEAGHRVMIPKGSRMIGTYNTGVLRGQNRVFIVWTRMIRPDGVDIQIGSEGTDPLGRAGVEGMVDNKFTELFTSAILSSVLTLGTAMAIEGNVKNSQIQQSNFTNGSTQNTSSPTAIASQDLVNNINSMGRSFMDEYFNLRPTITIDQGTRMKVFVNRDLIFSSDAAKDAVRMP